MQIVCTRATRFSSALVFQICRRQFIQILLAYYFIFERQNKKINSGVFLLRFKNRKIVKFAHNNN